MKYTYLLLNLLTLAIPLALSFNKKVHFISFIRHVIVAILLTLLIFIPWEMGFTAMGIWSFNSEYTLGINIGVLPLEECLLYITVPFIYLFIYEHLRVYIKRDFLRGTHFSLTPVAAIALSWLLLNNFDSTYTAMASAFLILLLLIQLIKLKRYMSWFFIAYGICLIPFFIINGLLTSLPIIEYNQAANLGINIGSIPVENFIYNAGLLLLVIMGYEWSKRKFSFIAVDLSQRQ